MLPCCRVRQTAKFIIRMRGLSVNPNLQKIFIFEKDRSPARKFRKKPRSLLRRWGSRGRIFLLFSNKVKEEVMKQDMILILDLGSEANPRLAREIRAMGVYTEIHPHDISAEELEALPGVKGIILNGGAGSATSDDYHIKRLCSFVLLHVYEILFFTTKK